MSGRKLLRVEENVAHGDDKCFSTLEDGAICRVFPNRDGIYKTPASARFYHKTRIPKVTVLAVCAHPRPEYGFDSKVGMFSFTRERLAKRSDVRTGTVVGETLVLEDVSVTAEEYRTKVIASPGVFQSMRQKTVVVSC